MPLLEVLLRTPTPPSPEARQAFLEEVRRIFAEELGTPPERLMVWLEVQPASPAEERAKAPADTG